MLRDPEGGDFRLQTGSPAAGYGCLTFPGAAAPGPEPDVCSRGEGRRRKVLNVAGLIEEDTVWDADTIQVRGDVGVADGVTLFIESGVRVEFQGFYALSIHGRLLALGEPTARVLFTSGDAGAFAVDSTLSGAWAGIRFPFTSETNATSRLEYCVIEYAKCAGDSGRGGGLGVMGFSKLELVNSVLHHNVADFGGGIACTHHAAPAISGCLIVGNYAFCGGSALHCVDAFPRLHGCTIVDNVDLNTQIFDPAAAIYAHLSKPQLVGCILRGNASHYFEPTQILYGKSYYTTWSNIGDLWPGEGNIDEDPLFVGSGAHPYGLQAGSPCINAGPADTSGLGLPAEDLAGNPRLVGGRVDMGAYEGHPDPAATGHRPRATAGLTCRPNPVCRQSVVIAFSLTHTERIRLTVHDAAGRRIACLAEGTYGPGQHEVRWPGSDASGRRVPGGIYFTRLMAAGGCAAYDELILLR